jgi:RHS repeat-associated protein
MQNEMYDFDLNGNRKTAKIQGKNESYQTGEHNRLLSDENYRYEYDQEGNRISKIAKDNTTTKYFWDHRNRLTKVQTPTESIEYIYDYQNRLVKRSQDNKTVTHFVHDGWQIILQFENKEIKPSHRYLWGTKQDELICNDSNWTLGDHLNTIRDTIKSDGTVVSHLEYNAFGKLISETKNDSFFIGYTGKLFDKSSDLQWNINRWYDSNIGKWTSEDPIGFIGNVTNVHCYVRNKTMNFVDVWGLVDDFFEINLPPNGEKCKLNCATPPPPENSTDKGICEMKYIRMAQGEQGKKCDNFLKEAINDKKVKKLIDKIKNYDKNFTIQILCKDCCGPCKGAGAWHFSSTPPAIYICQDQDFNLEKMVTYLLHELTHELQRVRDTPQQGCVYALKKEVEAYASEVGTSFADVYKGATWSSCFVKACTKNDIITNVNTIYEFWKGLL